MGQGGLFVQSHMECWLVWSRLAQLSWVETPRFSQGFGNSGPRISGKAKTLGVGRTGPCLWRTQSLGRVLISAQIAWHRLFSPVVYWSSWLKEQGRNRVLTLVIAEEALLKKRIFVGGSRTCG